MPWSVRISFGFPTLWADYYIMNFHYIEVITLWAVITFLVATDHQFLPPGHIVISKGDNRTAHSTAGQPHDSSITRKLWGLSYTTSLCSARLESKWAGGDGDGDPAPDWAGSDCTFLVCASIYMRSASNCWLFLCASLLATLSTNVAFSRLPVSRLSHNQCTQFSVKAFYLLKSSYMY